MNRQQARSIITETFAQAFDANRFLNFTANLLNNIDRTKAFTCNSQYVKDAFRQHVRRYERLATYTAPDQRKIDLMVVHLTEKANLARTRTALRNFVADYLKNRDRKDAALVAFVSPSEDAWRFSYVKMEYATVEKPTGDIVAEPRLTPARRFSYLVGPGESCHTAQARFLDLLQNTQTNPQLKEIEEAFSVEAVTKEFFARYKELALEVKDELDKLAVANKAVSAEFAARKVAAIDFAKKLLGQIVFLYFLQKKGWLGVGKGAQWGTGPRNFLRKLSNGDYGQRKNFFNDTLEPLFYDTLATDRGHAAFCGQFNCRIPFLNGGLFEPLNNYDWRKTEILLPNRLFTNTEPVDPRRSTEEAITGTGILDVFDRYNFTVNEAEPLEKEVAIDPEMLGKVFENLLEVKERKSKGSFYTPREIVHYMCQESLINYLDTAMNSGVTAQGDTGIPTCSPSSTQGETGIPACVSTTGEIHKTNRNLPHWTVEGPVYWITFRLADSLPQEKLNTWRAERELWLKQHPQPWSDEDWKQYDESLGERLQSWLDAGYGSCALARSDVRQIVQDCLLRFDGQRLRLHAAVIMPNHVHLLLEPLAGNELSELLKGIKGASARKVNQILGNTGNPFWMDESYDHIVRSERQRQHLIRYIMENPVKAQLPTGQFWLYQGDTGIPACSPSTPQGEIGIPACSPSATPIQGLETQTGMSVPRCDIEEFIHHGDRIADYDAVNANHGIEMPAAIKGNARMMDEKLAAITVCDPAVGSGAFLVGMMQEIVRARHALTRLFNDTNERSAYHFKRHAIQSCLYGVDIDPGAVEIAKLRLWLSLVVDEEDVKQIKPLPNLDYKVVVGNSLLGVEQDIFNAGLFIRLEALKPKYFDETDGEKKHGYRREIDQLIHQLTNDKETFDFEIYFSEVFRHGKKGFDVVIANPPYVRQEEITGLKPLLRTSYESYDGRADLFVYFYEQAVKVLKDGGAIAYISSNKWLRGRYGAPLRNFLARCCAPRILLDFGELPVFAAATFPMIFIGQKNRVGDCRFGQVKSLDPPYPNIPLVVEGIAYSTRIGNPGRGSWCLSALDEARVIEKMLAAQGRIPPEIIMAGIKTGLNSAFWLDEAAKTALIGKDGNCGAFIKPLLVGDDVRKWTTKPVSRWIIYTPIGTDVHQLGPIKDYLQKWKVRLEGRALSQAWYELQQAQQRYCRLFEKPKIVYPDIAKESRFTLDSAGRYIDMTAFALASSDLCLLAILNSKPAWFFLKRTAAVLGDAEKGGRLRLKRQFLEKIPIPVIPPTKQQILENLAERIRRASSRNTNADTRALDREIDQLVYQLYDLTPEEIAIVEGATKPPDGESGKLRK